VLNWAQQKFKKDAYKKIPEDFGGITTSIPFEEGKLNEKF
jgi:hypothetical protein